MPSAARSPQFKPVPRGIAKTGPAILSYGFRLFFLGAGLWALISMTLWIGALTLGWAPGGLYGAAYWHGHEMLFGYTSAAFTGFMLTAIPNWTGRLPIAGPPLLFLFLVWIAGRVAMLFTGVLGPMPSALIDFAYLPLLGLVAAREIGAGHNWKNLHIVVGVTLLTIGNGWYHYAVLNGLDNGESYRLAISTWTLLISLIGGRLAVSFTRNWLVRAGVEKLPKSFGLYDRIAILILVLTMALWIIAPDGRVTGVLALFAALLHFGRLRRWYGWHARAEPLVWILHAAYAYIPLGLIAISASTFGLLDQISAMHLLTVGAIGTMTVAVMTRVTRGHTGRQLSASATTTVSYFALILSALVRPIVFWMPDYYHLVLSISACLWLIAFTLFVGEHFHMWAQPRKSGGKATK